MLMRPELITPWYPSVIFQANTRRRKLVQKGTVIRMSHRIFARLMRKARQ